jgi:hypothetical protein
MVRGVQKRKAGGATARAVEPPSSGSGQRLGPASKGRSETDPAPGVTPSMAQLLEKNAAKTDCLLF